MEPTADDAVVAHLRARAPGLPAVRFDGWAVTARARRAVRRRRRLRTTAAAAVSGSLAYLVLAVLGPIPVPGGATVTLPGSATVREMVARLVPGVPPEPGQWPGDVDRLDRTVRPVVQQLRVYSWLQAGACRILEYPRGAFNDGPAQCGPGIVPFDAQARADFDRVTDAVERSGLPVDRVRTSGGVIYVQLRDASWQYNYEYAYLADTPQPPPARFPEERWTHIRGDWWFHRAHDD
ncbi:hypothetical protein [Dactylosporangium sucinum]|uniref:Uncharacterized protein n=1 Tax=Dactylosporangium sucinum TaxID=1424081 RepID=A0A917U1Z9_9ACTN|nr:hypothetical protein [Dactylosporangium sucinum]GGM47168.1 hypothetical protein GCM10007977_056010 [Dactylosporangium sucinum]